jgi:hypothetical protein
MLERLAFKTEYKNTKEYKNAAILSVIISLLFIILSIASFSVYTLAYTFGIGAIIYQIYALFVIYEMAHKKVKMDGVKHIVTLALFLLLLTAGIMAYKFDKTRIRENPLAIIVGFLAIMVPVFFWEGLFMRSKKIFKPILLMILIIPLFSGSFAQNETNKTGTLDQIGGVLDFAKGAVNFISDILGFFGGIQNTIQTMFGLEPGQAQIINIGIILVMVYFFLRTMKWIVKWVILILFVWIALQVLGIV